MDKKYPISEFPGYAITKNGEVFSCWSRGGNHISIITREWRKLKLRDKNNRGWLSVVLCKEGGRYGKRVSRLVLETFIGKCPEGMEACHNNNIRSDNALSNLRWDTHINNNNDKKKHGTWQCGEKHGMHKLNNFQIRRIRLMKEVSPNLSQSKVAKMFKVSQVTISNILRQKHWKHITI